MSTMRADTIADRPGTGSPTITGGELSRARFNLNGTGTIAARDSFNVSSFTDNGTGDYTATFSTAMPNADYSVGGSAQTPGTIGCVFYSGAAGQLAGSNRLGSVTTSPQNFTDTSYFELMFFGDKP